MVFWNQCAQEFKMDIAGLWRCDVGADSSIRRKRTRESVNDLFLAPTTRSNENYAEIEFARAQLENPIDFFEKKTTIPPKSAEMNATQARCSIPRIFAVEMEQTKKEHTDGVSIPSQKQSTSEECTT